MLFRLLVALLGSGSREPKYDRTGERKLTQAEKEKLEYRLWEMAEEFEEEE